KKETLATLEKKLSTVPIAEYKIIDTAQGQKVSRFIAWSYFDNATREHIFEEFM
ncbi:RlmF-related methyltransferase, partial [Pseudoalteromonas undina]